MSYAHADSDYRRELEIHFATLRRQGYVQAWDDREILPGATWASEISDAIQRSNLFIALVSPDFLASSYCIGKEFEVAMRRRREGEVDVVPVLVRTADFEDSPLAELQIVPKDATERLRPIKLWEDRDSAWVEVIRSIRRIIKPAHIAMGGDPVRVRRTATPARSEETPKHDWQLFALHVGHQIQRVHTDEQWSDDRFTELEAEVEAEGPRKHSFGIAMPGGVRREHSLTRAIERTEQQLILLQGEPGSGKSIALRHLAKVLAERAVTSWKAPIPVLVDLRRLSASPTLVDGKAIRDFVISQLRGMGDERIDRWLDSEFERGLEQGRWFFLFDGFDEIPAVLRSAEVDRVVRQYGMALESFALAMSRCRTVVASRPYRGPQQLGWTRFRIVPLSDARRAAFLRAYQTTDADTERIATWLALNAATVGSLRDNPLFLALLCGFFTRRRMLPTGVHDVYRDFVADRFTAQADAIKGMYQYERGELEEFAEAIAFGMLNAEGVGLSPPLSKLQRATDLHPERFDDGIDALVELRLGRVDVGEGDVSVFSFVHRRFQEFFATAALQRGQIEMKPAQLLSDPRWREPAAIVLQTKTVEAIQSLLQEATSRMEHYRDTVISAQTTSGRPFPWPERLLHLLSLLQDGLRGRIDRIPDALQQAAGRALRHIYTNGTLLDRKLVLDSIGVLDRDAVLRFVSDGLVSRSDWLFEAAFSQAGLLPELPESSRSSVRRWLLREHWANRLTGNLLTVRAQLARLPKPAHFEQALALCRAIALTDKLLAAVLIAFLVQIVMCVLSEPELGFISRSIVVVVLALTAGITLKRSWNEYARSVEFASRKSRLDETQIGNVDITKWHALGFLSIGSMYFFIELFAYPIQGELATATLVVAATCAWWSNSAHSAIERGSPLRPRWWWMLFLLTPWLYLRLGAKGIWWLVTHPLRVAQSLLAVVVVTVLMPILFPLIVALSMKVGGVWCREYWIRKRWLQEPDRMLDSAELLSRLSTVTLPTTRLVLLNDVYRRRRLRDDMRSQRDLENLGVRLADEFARAASRAQARDPRPWFPDGGKAALKQLLFGLSTTPDAQFQDFEGWLASYLGKTPLRFANWTDKELDMIWMLVEQLRVRRGAGTDPSDQSGPST